MDKKLTKKANGQMLCGVCNGIADYLNADPTLVRLAAVLLSFGGGMGIFLYIAAAVIMPNEYNG